MTYHSYVVFDSASACSGSPEPVPAAAAKEFIACIESQERVLVRSYATLGLKAGTRFMLHLTAATPEELQSLIRDLTHTQLGRRLRLVQTLLGMTRPSSYNPGRAPEEGAAEKPHRYVVVYPFTKTIEWHLLPYETRKRIMQAHIAVGAKYHAEIAQLLLYSFGIDDHEFIVSYYMDSLEAFQRLVMDMRSTESRRYTKNDLPIFLGIAAPLAQALTML